MDIIFTHFWMLFIVVTCINTVIIKYRTEKYIKEKPERKVGYKKFIEGLLIYGNIPWIIMGIGIMSGMVNGSFAFFSPRNLNPIVLIFHASIIVLWILGVYWIYFNKGAEFIEEHPGLIQKSGFGDKTTVTAQQVKMFFPIMLLGGIVGMILMWTMTPS